MDTTPPSLLLAWGQGTRYRVCNGVGKWGLDKHGLDYISTNLESIRAGRVGTSDEDCKEGVSERTL